MYHKPIQFGQYYHIYNRGNNGENLFVQERNYPYFLRLYTKYILPVAETFAYCLMPNHFHFLVRTRTEDEQKEYLQIGSGQDGSDQIGSVLETEPITVRVKEPSRAFNNMFIAYARAFNKATNRTGVLFETPFRRKQVVSDAHFYRLVAYIHLNPQKHGFVDDFREWNWSSYGALISEAETHLGRAEVMDWYGGQDAFAEYHQQPLDEVGIVEWIGEDD